MSHFTVMVIGPDPTKQLQPYHEYECTGTEDEYVVDVDCTEEIDGWLKDEIFVGISKESGKLDYHWTEEDAIEKFQSVEKMARADYFAKGGLNIDTEVEEYHGYVKKDGKWIRRTNPNKKWDWYVLGGRWAGFLKIKEDGGTLPNGTEFVWTAVVGNPSFMGPQVKDGWADQAVKAIIDFDFMKSSKREDAIADYKELAAKFGGEIPKLDFTWKECLADESIPDITQRREKYHTQPAMLALKAIPGAGFTDMEDYQCTESEYGDRAAASAFSTYAIVKDSKWYSKGDMGWFGMSRESVTQDEWNLKVSEMIESLPDDTLISIYDCHI